MNYKILIFLLLPLFGFSALSQEADLSAEDTANGNLISEPELADYVQANRAPGILVEPYDIIDSDSAN